MRAGWKPGFLIFPLFSSGGLEITETPFGYQITAEKECTLSVNIEQPPSGKIVLLDFEVDNLTSSAVVIDINDIRNKLSGRLRLTRTATIASTISSWKLIPAVDSDILISLLEKAVTPSAMYNGIFMTKICGMPGAIRPLRTKAADSTADTSDSVLVSGTIEAENSGYLGHNPFRHKTVWRFWLTENRPTR